VLLIEGTQEEENAPARQAVEQALTQVTDRMASLPKEIEEPPVLLTLSPEQHEQERLLLWSLGIEPTDLEHPHAAILYGRGRRIGEVFSGEKLNRFGMHDVLSVVGESCECGLDRDWLLGTMIPHRWDAERRQTVVRLLGFDAESPLVKSEISQIMAKGNSAQTAAENAGIAADPFFGYTELTVMEPDPAMVSAQENASKRETAEMKPASPTPQTVDPAAILALASEPASVAPAVRSEAPAETLPAQALLKWSFVALGVLTLGVIAGGLGILLRAKKFG
jgi:hypothetical protein